MALIVEDRAENQKGYEGYSSHRDLMNASVAKYGNAESSQQIPVHGDGWLFKRVKGDLFEAIWHRNLIPSCFVD